MKKHSKSVTLHSMLNNVKGKINMKKLIALIMCAAMLSLSAFADGEDITVSVNGETIQADTTPQIVNDRTMLPMRAIFEALGADVTWVEESKLIFATKGDTMIVMQIDNEKMSVQHVISGESETIVLDTAPYIYNDRTMVPVRAVAESLNATVQWDGDARAVAIVQN